jgi:hypothetical protein
MKSSTDKQYQSRRKFLGTAGAVAVAGVMIGGKPLVGGGDSVAVAADSSEAPTRMNRCFAYRRDAAIANRNNVGDQPGNGDLARYSDFSGMYSKGLLHDALGIPNAAAAESLIRAFQTGKQSDFDSIIVGTPGGGPNSKLNGPQLALAFDLEGVDSHSTVIPPAPTIASVQTAAEMVEHYWASLLVDIPFAEYDTHPLVGEAVADMNNMSYLHSTSNKEFPYPVTPQNLFRGQFLAGDGNVKGPYVSQFMLQPTYYGVQWLDQRYRTCLPEGGGGFNYMTSVAEYQSVQNGGDSGKRLIIDPLHRYIRNGRDLTCYTNVDVLFQAYLTAFLVLANIGAAPNPGNPYNGSVTQKAFATLGNPDAAATLCEVATRALKASWYHKWIKDLKIRPEEYGALVQARMTGANPMPQAATELHSDVLNSMALSRTFSKYGTYLLPQAFPEGSPTHPCYPTGHGTVGGACCTVLKFFFNGTQKLRPLLNAAGTDIVEPSPDGLSLNYYNGADRDSIDVNGELNKLAWNVSVGHGIHAGIHFRSSTYWSILLGEQVGLAILRDRAKSYNEPFTISIRKFDGSTATITNQ